MTQYTDIQLMDHVDECLHLSSETDWVEFKENFFDYSELWKRISGLSNAANINGKEFWFLIYGIRDQTLDLVGSSFSPDSEKVWSAPFEFQLSQDIKWITVSIKTISYKSKKLVIFIIPAAIDQPTSFRKEAYIRIGSGTTELSRHIDKEKQIWTNLYNRNFERQMALSGLEKEEINLLLDIDAYFTLLDIQKPDAQDEALQYLIQDKIIKKTLARYDITNLWALLFARNIEKFDSIKRKGIRTSYYNGIDRAADTKSVDGNTWYALWFEELLRYIQTILPTYEKIIDGKRIQTNIYPAIAIRELVANALIHQDLSITGTSPLIEIFLDRIEITNPGILLIPKDRLIDFPPKSRNEDLASMMRRMHFCEEKWTGIDKVIISTEKSKSPPPNFIIFQDSTRAILYWSDSLEHLTKEDRLRACYFHCVIEYVSHRYMTNPTLRERLSLPETQTSSVSRIIKEAVKGGLIKPFDPENKAPRYQKYVPYWAS